MSASAYYNTFEIFLWSVVGVGFIFAAIRRKNRERRHLLGLGLAFLVFGFSDYIEIQTGAWWRPLWLLLLKAACVAVFLLAFRRHLVEQAEKKRENIAKEPPNSVPH